MFANMLRFTNKRLEINVFQIAILVFCLLFNFASPGFASSQSDAINTGDMVINLENNLRVILVRQPTYPVVSCQLWYHIGKSGEKKHEKGACYAVKHTLDTQPLYEDQNTSLRLIKSACNFDSFISDDFTAFIVNATADKLSECLKVQSERFNTVTLRSKWMHKGIKASINKFDSNSMAPYFIRLRKEVRSIALPNCSNNQILKASHEEHLNASASKVRAFYHQQFLNAPVTLVIAGNFDSEKTLSLVQKLFSKSRSTKKKTALAVNTPHQSSERSFTRFIKGNSNHLLISYKTDVLQNKKVAPLIVLESLLNNKVNGILKHRFQEEGICTNCDAMLELKRNTGLFSIYLVSDHKVGAELVLKDVDLLFDSLKEVSIDKVSLDRAKKRAILKFLKNRSGPQIAAYQHGFYDSIGLHNNLNSWIKDIASVSSDELNEVCKKLLNKKNRTVGIFKAKDLSIDSEGYTKSDLCAKVSSDNSFQEENQASDTSQANTEIQTDKSKVITRETVKKLTKDASAKTKDGQYLPTSAAPTSVNESIWQGCNVETQKLENGITLQVVTVPNSKLISIYGSLKAGHVFDPKNRRGLSLVNTSLMNGSSKNISENKSKNLQSNNGLDEEDLLVFENGIDFITFHSNCLTEDIDTQLKLLSHHIRHPNLNDDSLDDALEKARSTIIAESRNTRIKLKNHLLRSLLSTSSTYRPTQLNKQLHLLKQIKKDDVIAFRSKTIVPSNLKIAVVGGITMEELVNHTNTAFADWNDNATQASVPAIVRNKRQVLKVIIPNANNRNTDSLVIGKLFSKPFDTAQPLLSITDCILIQHPILGKLIKYKHSEPITAHLHPVGDQTLWNVFLNAKQRDLERTFSTFKKEVVKLASLGISSKELADSKTYLTGHFTINKASNMFNLSKAIIQYSDNRHKLKTPLDTVRSINQVELAEINQFINNRWNPSASLMVFEIDKASKNLTRRLNLHK